MSNQNSNNGIFLQVSAIENNSNALKIEQLSNDIVHKSLRSKCTVPYQQHKFAAAKKNEFNDDIQTRAQHIYRVGMSRQSNYYNQLSLIDKCDPSCNFHLTDPIVNPTTADEVCPSCGHVFNRGCQIENGSIDPETFGRVSLCVATKSEYKELLGVNNNDIDDDTIHDGDEEYMLSAGYANTVKQQLNYLDPLEMVSHQRKIASDVIVNDSVKSKYNKINQKCKQKHEKLTKRLLSCKNMSTRKKIQKMIDKLEYCVDENINTEESDEEGFEFEYDKNNQHVLPNNDDIAEMCNSDTRNMLNEGLKQVRQQQQRKNKQIVLSAKPKCKKLQIKEEFEHLSHTGRKPIKTKGASIYDPDAHFAEHLKRGQGLGRVVEMYIVRFVAAVLWQYYIGPDEVTIANVNWVLKRHRLIKYYGSHVQIWARLTKKTPMLLKPEHEQILKDQFKAIRERWNDLRVSLGRTNLFLYPLTIHVLCILNGYNDYVRLFPLLVNKSKLQYQICKQWPMLLQELGWNVKT